MIFACTDWSFLAGPLLLVAVGGFIWLVRH